MITYKSTFQYKILSLFGIITACFLVLFGLLSALTGSYFSFLFMLLPGIILLYLLLFAFPGEILVDEEWIEFKAKLRKINLKYSEIREVKPHFTTRTLTLTGGDKDKAAVYYSIKIKDRPMSLLLFGSGICEYRELYEHLKNRIHP